MANRGSICLALLILFACQGDNYTTPEKYLKWVNNPANGLSKAKQSNGLSIQLKYLPHEYFLLNDLTNKAEQKLDRSQLSFVLSWVPILPEEPNVMMRNINSEKDFKERVHQMNFGFGYLVTLKFNKKKYEPVIANLENTYNIRPGKNINLVFDLSLKELKEHQHMLLEVQIIDELFETGIHHFSFKPSDLINVPKPK